MCRKMNSARWLPQCTGLAMGIGKLSSKDHERQIKGDSP